MLVEVNSRNVNKLYYKLFIVVLKYTPILIALCYVLNTVTAVFGIYHRMFLWYILIDDLLNIIDYYYELPIETSNLLMIHNSIIGIFLFIILYIYVKDHKKSTGKNIK